MRDSVLNLAVFRIVFALVFLSARDLWEAPRWAALAPSVRSPPPGSEWLLDVVPLSEDAVRIGVLLLAAALVAGAIGLFTRTAFALATLLGLWILAVPQLAGFVFHEHHLIWFSALLAASPSGDALSVDAWRRRGRLETPPPSAAYGIPIRAVWVTIAIIFFFPGLWKLLESGPAWIWSDNLRNHMYAKWIQFDDFEPLFRIDRYPLLVRLAALLVVTFELSFPVLISFRRTRPLAALAAIGFHLGTRAFMGLDFSLLYGCYVVFLDLGPLLSRFIPTGAPEGRRLLAPALMGGVILAGAGIAGAAGNMGGWPFACYPTFQWIAKAEMPVLAVELVMSDGSIEETLLDEGSQRTWALRWSLAGALERPPDKDRLRAYRDELAQDPEIGRRVRRAEHIRFFRAYVSTIPEEDRRVLRREILAEIK